VAPGWFFLGQKAKRVAASIPPLKVFFKFFFSVVFKMSFCGDLLLEAPSK
jgi:hypothetical protein